MNERSTDDRLRDALQALAVLIAVVFLAADAIALWALNQTSPDTPVIFSDPNLPASTTPVVRIGQP